MPHCAAGGLCVLPDLEPQRLCIVCGCRVHDICGFEDPQQRMVFSLLQPQQPSITCFACAKNPSATRGGVLPLGTNQPANIIINNNHIGNNASNRNRQQLHQEEEEEQYQQQLHHQQQQPTRQTRGDEESSSSSLSYQNEPPTRPPYFIDSEPDLEDITIPRLDEWEPEKRDAIEPYLLEPSTAKKSVLWAAFMMVSDEHPNPSQRGRACCNFCGTSIRCIDGTGGLVSHLSYCKNEKGRRVFRHWEALKAGPRGSARGQEPKPKKKKKKRKQKRMPQNKYLQQDRPAYGTSNEKGLENVTIPRLAEWPERHRELHADYLETPINKRSTLWNGFMMIRQDHPVEHERGRACCNFCGTTVKGIKGTGGLSAHLPYCKNNLGRRFFAHWDEAKGVVQPRVKPNLDSNYTKVPRVIQTNSGPNDPPHKQAPNTAASMGSSLGSGGGAKASPRAVVPPKPKRLEVKVKGPSPAAMLARRHEYSSNRKNKTRNFSLYSHLNKEQMQSLLCSYKAVHLTAASGSFQDADTMAYQKVLQVAAYCYEQDSLVDHKSDEVQARAQSLASLLRDRVGNKLQGETFTITTEEWRDNNMPFYAVSAHWIDSNVDVHSTVVSVSRRRKADRMAQDLQARVFEDWKFSQRSMAVVVTDTSPVMESFGKSLRVNCNSHHIYCMDNLLRLVAKVIFDSKGLEWENGRGKDHSMGETDESDDDEFVSRRPDSESVFDIARGMINFFQQDKQALEDLEKIHSMQKEADDEEVDATDDDEEQQTKSFWLPKMDVDKSKGWLPMYSMLSRCADLGWAFDAWSSANDGPPRRENGQLIPFLTKGHYQLLRDLKCLLKPLADIQQMLEGDKFISVGEVPFLAHCVRCEYKAMKESSEDFDLSIRRIAGTVYQRIEDLFGKEPVSTRGDGLPSCAWVAHALDPRFRHIPPLEDEEEYEAEKVWKMVREAAVQLRGETTASVAVDRNEETTSIDPSENPPPEKKRKTSHGGSLLSKLTQKHWKNRKSIPNKEASKHEYTKRLEAEIKSYKELDPMDYGTCPREWWKSYKHLYPILWDLARVYLAIPACAVSLDRPYSRAGKILAATRKSLIYTAAAPNDLHFLVGNQDLLSEKDLLGEVASKVAIV